jgi:hypothetical protein
MHARHAAGLLLVAATAAVPAMAAAQSSDPLHLECAGPFARDASEAGLKTVFGEANVRDEMIDGPEGSTLDATLVFPDDPAKRLVVLWHDEAARTHPAAIIIQEESSWIGPGGIRLGTTLAEAEAANGEPFRILGFGWDYGGSASFPSGTLAAIPGGCTLSLTFSPNEEELGPEYDSVLGDQEFLSDNALIRQLEPAVTQIAVGYPI